MKIPTARILQQLLAAKHITYYYTAYEDDNGYSMLHRGIYINTEAGYYTADFSMMEGDTGEYYEMAGLYLAQISFVD